MAAQKPNEKKDRLEEIRQEIARFSQQVNDYLKGARKEGVPRVATENELAILRHARAIVEEQLRNPPDEESNKKLVHLKAELDRRIALLAEAIAGNHQAIVYSPRNSLTPKEKAAVAGLAVAGISLIAIGAYLVYQGTNSNSENF